MSNDADSLELIRDMRIAGHQLADAHFEAVERLIGSGCPHPLREGPEGCECGLGALGEPSYYREGVLRIWSEFMPKYYVLAARYRILTGEKL